MKKILLILTIIIGTLLYLLPNSGSAFAQTQSAQTENTQSPILIKNVEDLATPQNTLNQNQNINPQTLPMNTNPDVPHNLSTYTQSVFIELLGTASCFMSGYNPISIDGRCLGIDPVTKKLGYAEVNGGLVSLMGNLIGSTYDIPISSGNYGRYLANNFGITQNTYAQGVGFDGLRSVLPIWTAFRNITYLAFIIVFILIGLGVMFRINDTKAVMTIQNKLPKITITLVLITFSYAIAGFLIDMMYVSIYLSINVFNAPGLVPMTVIDTNPINAAGGMFNSFGNPGISPSEIGLPTDGSLGNINVTDIIDPFVNPLDGVVKNTGALNPVGGLHSIVSPPAESAAEIMSSLFKGNIGSNVGKMVTTVAGAMLGGQTGSGIGGLLGGLVGMLGGPAGAAAGATIGAGLGTLIGAGIGLLKSGSILAMVASIIAYLVILVAVLSALFRTWFILIKAYIMIIVAVIFAPFWILGGLFSNEKAGFTPWIKSLVANLAAFPIVMVLFMIGASIQNSLSPNSDNFVPPLIGDPGSVNSVASLIALGIILIMPEAANLAKSLIGAPDVGIASAAARPLGMGVGFISKPVKSTFGEMFGKDVMGNPRAGSRWVGQNLGFLTGALTGGGLSREHYGKVQGGAKAAGGAAGKIGSMLSPFGFGRSAKLKEKAREKSINRHKETIRTEKGYDEENMTEGEKTEVQGLAEHRHAIVTEKGYEKNRTEEQQTEVGVEAEQRYAKDKQRRTGVTPPGGGSPIAPPIAPPVSTVPHTPSGTSSENSRFIVPEGFRREATTANTGPTREQINQEVEKIKEEEKKQGKLLSQSEIVELQRKARERLERGNNS